MSDDENKSRLVQLIPGSDGEIIGVPVTRKEETDPTPAEDGKYYLAEGFKSVQLALRMSTEGVEVYCAMCKAPLKVSPYFVFCTKNERHYSVTMYRKP